MLSLTLMLPAPACRSEPKQTTGEANEPARGGSHAVGTGKDGAGKDGAGKDSAGKDNTAGKDNAGEASTEPWQDPARTHLLLARHGHGETTAEYLPVSITGAEPATAPALRVPAMPFERWPGHFVSQAAHGGQERFVVATGTGAPWQLQAFTVGAEQPGARVDLGEVQPAALHLVGEQVLLGQGNTVARVDLSASPPARVTFHSRSDMAFKAYDLFVRSGEWLLAIDDVVTPIYAESLGLDADGAPTHEAGWELPGAINGHYQAGVLARRPGHAPGEREATLFVLLGYGIMDGHGQDLAALPIRAGALAVEPQLILNSGAQAKLPVLEEHVDRSSGKPTSLIAGADFSPWTAIARHVGKDGSELLLLCAGPRDLLALPVDFGPNSKAATVEIPGDCLDLLITDDRIWALVDPDPAAAAPQPEGKPPAASELLELALSPGPAPTATILHRLPLTGHHRFVR